MRGLIFMLLIPSLMAANVLCPNGKTTCPEELYCCEIDGEHRCCDDYAATNVPDTKIKVYPGIETTAVQASTLAFSNASMSADVASSYGTCSMFNCEGPCCSTYNCCPHKFGSCCTSTTCCTSFGSCCVGGCCGFMSKCCGSGCCSSGDKCCTAGSDKWCCDAKYSCGSYMTCRNKGIAFSPEITTVLVLALGFLMSRYL